MADFPSASFPYPGVPSATGKWPGSQAGTAVEFQASDFLTKASGTGNFETVPAGTVGLVIARTTFGALTADATRSMIGSLNSGLGFSAGSLYLQPRGGVSAEIVFGIDGVAQWKVASNGHLMPVADNAENLGGPSNRLSQVYATTATINTSDAREKTAIGAIPEPWLDAWGAVDWMRFKWIVGTRWHTGLTAQQVHAAFAAEGIDAFEIGLCCFDAWDADATAGRIAGDRWGLRYEECFAIEAAWQRRELARMDARLAALEAGV